MALSIDQPLYAIKAEYEDGSVRFWGNRHGAPFLTERNAQKHRDWLDKHRREYPKYSVVELRLEVKNES